jgi:hypothetical protein
MPGECNDRNNRIFLVPLIKNLVDTSLNKVKSDCLKIQFVEQ